MSDTLTSFTAGDLVISISGDGDGSGTYTDNQASPIVLEELTTSGTVVGQMVLPQTTTVVNGVTEYAISGEYGSSSEGSLELAGNGESLVIMGYGVNAATYNEGGAAVYGNAALAQSTSVPGGEYTAVPRVIADISYNGTVDTSTALYNVFNTNNPRSVATVNGTTFYISGQGVKGDTTQGVFLAHDGASSATPIDNSTDTRTVEIVNGELYVSRDSTQGSGGTSNIATYGTTLPTGATTPIPLPGIDGTVTLTAAQENGINNADLGQIVNLSPENYFFASSTVLYVADGGDPKEGGLGDGGLQKWVFNGSTWVLQYTLSTGLDLVPDTATSGTTGLIGLTGTVIGGVAYLFATNETVGDLDQTYVYDIADQLNATSVTSGTSALGPDYDTFTALVTAAADTNIRGISFAPSAAAATTPTATTVSGSVISSGLTVTSGSSLTVLSGGTIEATTLLAGGSAVISGGGVDSGTDIANGATETVFGSASGDYVDGVQLVSSTGSAVGVVSDESILNGGSVELFAAGSIGNALTVETGGLLAISGRGTAEATVLSGGTLILESSKSTLSGTLTFAGAATLEEDTTVSITSSGVYFGDQAVISGFGAGDVIDLTSATAAGGAGSAATFSVTTSGGETLATVSGGGSTETFIFAGTAIANNLTLVSDGAGGEEITYSAPPPVSTTISSGVTASGLAVTSGSTVDALTGGTVVAATVYSGGFMQIEAGAVDSGSVISSGGTESVLGSASGDLVYGTQVLSSGSSAVVSNETIYSGGSVELFLAGVIGNALTVEAGGVLAINGRGTAEATVLNGGTLMLESPKSTLSGTLTFIGPATLEEIATISPTSSGVNFGDQAVISGFGAGDVIDLTSATAAGGAGAAATFSVTTSDGDTLATVSGGGSSETFIFAGTTIATSLSLVSDGNGGEEIVTGSGTTSSGGSSGGSAISVTSGVTSSNLVVSGGSVVDVLNGGTLASAVIQSGGVVVVSSGGFDSASTIGAGGSETVIGSASQDAVYGSQTVAGAISGETIFAGGFLTVQAGATDTGSTIEAGGTESVLGSASGDQVYGTQVLSSGASAVVTNETIYSGGSVELFLAGVIGNGLTVEAGGALAINGRGTAEATVLNGGTLLLESSKSTLSGTLTFEAPSTLEETTTVSVTSGGLYFGDMAVISGFGAGDVIDLTSASKAGSAGSAATFSVTTSGGETLATVSGGGSTETFIFAGTAIANSLSLVSDGAGGEEIVYAQPAGEWATSASGDFDSPANWTGNAVPSGLANAVIDWANDPVVTHDTGNDLMTSLTNEAGDFVMAGGTLTAAFLTNDATMSWTGGALVLNTGSAATGMLQNAAGASLTIAADGQSLTAIGSGTASVQNAGTILVTGGSGETDIDAAVDNTGSIIVNQGTLSLNAGGTSSASGLRGGTGGVLQFGTVAGTGTGGTFTLGGGTYIVANTVVNGSTLNAAGASGAIFTNALSLAGAGSLNLGSLNAADQGTLSMTGGEIAGSGTLSVYGVASLSSGLLAGSGSADLLYATTVSGTIDLYGGYTLNNAGRLNWTGGDIVLGGGIAGVGATTGSLVNEAGGVFYITADGDIAAPGTASVGNAGVMVVYAGSGTTDIDAALSDTGVIQLQSGTLSLNGGGSMSAANLFVSPSAVLQFGTTATGGNGTFAITSGAYAIANTVISGSTLDVSSASGAVFSTLLDVTAGSLTLGSLSATDQDELQQTGGTIGGSGTLTVYGAATLTGGVQTGSGVTDLLGTATIGGSFDVDGGRSIVNQGWLNWSSGDITLGAGDPGATTQTGTLDNAGVLYATADGDLMVGASSGSVLDNSGVLAVLAGSGTTTIDATLDNTGVIQVQNGVLQLDGGGSSAGGNIYVASDAVLQFGSVAGGTGTFAITGGVYDVAQTAVEGGTLDLSAATAVGFGTSLGIGGGTAAAVVQLGSVTASSGALSLNTGGTLVGSGFFFVGGDAQLGGGLQTGDGATILTQDASIIGSTALDGGRTLENDATLTWTTGTLTVGGGDPSQSTHSAAFSNVSGAVVDIEGDVAMTTAGSGFFANAGTVVKTGGLGDSVVSVAVNNAGTVDVSSGTLTFAGAMGGAGTFILDGTATLDLINGAGAGSTMQFALPGGTLETSVQSTFASTISGFAAGDEIDAAGIGFVSGTTSVGFSGGTLTVAEGGASAAFILTGSYTPGMFQLGSDGHGGTAITLT